VVAVAFAGCAPPGRGAAGAGLRLYVANAADATITQIDGASGRATAVPLPAGVAPEQVARGPAGSLLILSHAATTAAEVIIVSASGSGRVARSMRMEAGRARRLLLAGDGGPVAAVAYHVPADDRDARDARALVCRLALVDVPAGVVARTLSPCGADEVVKALAVESGPASATVYLGLVRQPSGAAGRDAAPGGRVVAVDTHSGAAVAVAPLSGVPAHLLLAPAPESPGRRLYVVEAVPGPDGDDADGGRWRLLGLDPLTLDVQQVVALPFLPTGFVVAPDGSHAFALTPPNDAVRDVDLTTGSERVLARLPGTGLGLAAAGDRVYVSNPYGRDVWEVDRRAGRLVRTIPSGAHPVAIAASDSPSPR
jgi:DNA-binding beta-propeller fold protein YncE